MSDKPSSQPPAFQSKFMGSAFEKVNQERRETAKAAEKSGPEPQGNKAPPRLHAPEPYRALQMKGPGAQEANREAFFARQQMTDRYARAQIEKTKAQEAERQKTKDDKTKDLGDHG